MRRQLAATLETVLENAEEPPGPTAAAPLDREAVLGSRRAIVALVARLRAPRPVRPQGVAMVRRLLVDATGPLYRHQPAAATLAGVLDVALRALEPMAELRLAA